MRVLQVIHQFPPYSSQGSEVYCLNLSKQLRATDDVRVFHVSNIAPRWPRRLMRDTHEGLTTYHCVDGAEYARIADWPNPFLRTTFQTVLSEFAPEVVHFHNYVSLGDDLVTAARGSGAAVVYTLHDFGLMCPNCLLLRTDGALCGKADPDFFQDCCPVVIRTSSPVVRSVTKRMPSLARWRMYADRSARPLVRAPLRVAVGLAERWLGEPAHSRVARKREFFLTQTRRIYSDADVFLAPSEFLRKRYVASGLPADKVQVNRYGLRPFQRVDRGNAGGRIAFGYIGALHPHKGVELLLQAFRGLGGRADLHIYGSAFGSPISQNYSEGMAARDGSRVTFHGEYDNQQIANILGSLDVIVVPSLWYENSPLTIQEAFIGGVPVITANQGGMAELVRDGIDGLHFEIGDAASLREKLQSVIDNPGLLMELRRNIPPVPDIATQATAVRTLYERVRSKKMPAQR